MNYKTLQAIYDKRVSINSNTLPVNSFNVAQSLHIRVKNSAECKIDYKERYPLYNCDAFYSVFNGESIIYYDERHPYQNFFIAHEIAHHVLKHIEETESEYHDANLLAAIIVAPLNLIKTSNIKSATELSSQCKIPIDVSEEYWSEIKSELTYISKFKQIYINHKPKVIVTVLSFLAVLIGGVAFLTVNNNNNIGIPNYQSNVPSTAYSSTYPTATPNYAYEDNILTDNIDNSYVENETVFVTQYGKKYHKQECFHIQNSVELIELSVDKATENGYEACKHCFRYSL